MEGQWPGTSGVDRLSRPVSVANTVILLGNNETLEELKPSDISGIVDVEIVGDAAEKLGLGVVDVGERDARDLGPSLVRVRVVVQKLVGHHQSDHGNTVLAAGRADDCHEPFEAPNVVEREDNDALGDLGCLEQLLHKGHKFGDDS